MTPAYPWRCLACDQTNQASAAHCERCGCPAFATRAQVDEAREDWQRRNGMPCSKVPDALALIRQMPLLKIAAALLLGLGALALIVGGGSSAFAFGGLLVSLAALCLSADRAPQRPAAAG